MRTYSILGLLLVLLLTLGAGPALAAECKPDVEAAARDLKLAQDAVPGLPKEKQSRVEAFLADGEKMLERARRNCAIASSPWEILNAKAMALVSQGNIAAAHLLIREAGMDK